MSQTPPTGPSRWALCLVGLGLSALLAAAVAGFSPGHSQAPGIPPDIAARSARWLFAVLAIFSLTPLVLHKHAALAGQTGPAARSWPWLLAAFAASPFWLMYAAHFWENGEAATGFLQYDMAYYLANGREIFERGNGWMYCNPYDPRPEAPVIYFHWLMWVMGVAVMKLGCDPGLVSVAICLAGGWVCAYFTYRLVAAVVADRRWEVPCFLLAMWGGGAFVLWEGLAVPPLDGNLAALFRGEPAGGDWCLNWGRNLFYPTEAVYHALVAIAWWGVAVGRRGTALAAVCLLAATHPFSGAQHLAIITLWFALRTVWTRQIQDLACLLLASAASGLFGWYYFVYLPGFAEHRELQHTWELDWSFPLGALLLAHLFVLPAAIQRLIQDRLRLPPAAAFLALACLVSLALSKHELLIAPRQPLHFARGYTWLPLLLIGWPAIAGWLAWLQARLHGWRLAAALAAGMLVACSDNAAWIAMKSAYANTALYLQPDERDMLRAANQRRLRGLLVCSNSKVSYLAATYTSLDPYWGHVFNTPQRHEKTRLMPQFFEFADKPGPADVEELKQSWRYLLIPFPQQLRTSPKLEVIHRNDNWLLARPKQPGA
ncbi:MAG: hypothetical protein AB7O62_11925 [Pirellulales bacterium]